MPDPDDFYAFKSTSSGSGGCCGGCLGWILAALAILWLIGKCAG